MDILNSHLLSSKGIYKIINKVNGKYYIGMTNVSFNKRMRSHVNRLRCGKHINNHLQAAFNKYNEVNFIFECFIDMSHFTKEEVVKKEESLILENYKSKMLYNSLIDGWKMIKRDDESYNMKHIQSKKARRVYQFDKNYNLIDTHQSALVAAKITGYRPRRIYNSLQSKRECVGDYHFIYEDVYLNNPNIKLIPLKQNLKLDFRVCSIVDGKVDKIFKSIKQAGLEFGVSGATITRRMNGETGVLGNDFEIVYYQDLTENQKELFNSTN